MGETDALRRRVRALLKRGYNGDCILAPGSLIALQIVFYARGIKRLVMTTEEYYSKQHFPMCKVTFASPQNLARVVLQQMPDAVIASVVSWKGKPLNVGSIYGDIKNRLKIKTPLLIVDYHHGGALGFPHMDTLNADIVFGDFEKWISKPGTHSNITFLWFSTKHLFGKIRKLFTVYHLAVDCLRQEHKARWINSGEISKFIENKQLLRTSSRHELTWEHGRNKRLSKNIALFMGLGDPESNILFVPNSIKSRIPTCLIKRKLVWFTGEGARVMCRANCLSKGERNQFQRRFSTCSTRSKGKRS